MMGLNPGLPPPHTLPCWPSRFPARLLDKFRDGVRAFVQSARPQWSRALSETEAWAVVTYTSELYDDGPALAVARATPNPRGFPRRSRFRNPKMGDTNHSF